ncbi:MAG: ComEC family competence protein [Oscillospiraceae bacterium]|nr:ComEC family competence protein [Oscillospiraceae bacterium]
MRHEAGLAAGGALTGLLFCFYADLPMRIALIALAAVLLVAGLAILTGQLRKAVSTAFLFLLIFSVYGTVWFHLRADRLTALSGETVTVSGIVTDCSDSDRSEVTISGTIGGIRGKAIVYLSGYSISPGDRITFEATVSELTDSAGFSASSYYNPKGIFVRCYQTGDIAITPASGIYALYGELRSYKERLTTALCSYVGLNEGQLLSSMLCGTSESLDTSVRASLNRSGIGHLLAVSGLHVSIVAALVAFFLKLLRAPRPLTFIASESIMALFVVFSGMRISAVRAFIMMTVYLLSFVIKREYDVTAALGVTILIMLAFSPYSVADGSFLLSVSGVFGAAVVGEAVSKAFSVRGRFKRAAVTYICVYFCILPVSVFVFDEISLVSVITNLLLTPFCTVALVLTLVFAACGTPAGLSFLIEIAGFIARWVIKICGFIANLGFTYIPIKYAAVRILILSLTAAVVIILIVSKNVRLATFSAAAAFLVTVAAMFALMVSDSGTTHLKIISDGDGYLLVVYQGGECIVVDSDGSYPENFGYILSEEGLTTVDAVAILSNGIANYSAYLNLSTAPDIILFQLSPSAHASSETELLNLTDGSSLSLGSAEVLISGGCTIVTMGGRTIVITESEVPQDGYYIYIADGVCVTNVYGEVMVAKEGMEIEISGISQVATLPH